MTLVVYVSHPQVVIDPAIPVPDWRLTPEGLARVERVARQPWARRIQAIATSPERKARETADLLAVHSYAPICVLDDSGEIDRSSTGYVPHAEHERLADLLFAFPEKPAEGWERAVDAQRRIVDAVKAFVSSHAHLEHIAMTGHGGVGTLLSCALQGVTPARALDQPHGGCAFAWDTRDGQLLFPWTPIEHVTLKLG